MKIPDPKETKKQTLAGQRRIAEEEEQKANLAAEDHLRRKRLIKNWKSLSRKLVHAAIAGNDSLDVESVTFPIKLIELDLEIEEIGNIAGHYNQERPAAILIQDLKKAITQFSGKVPESSLKIWGYWADIDRELMFEVERLLNKKQANFRCGELKAQLENNIRFKRLNLTAFRSALNEIQEAAEKVKKMMLTFSWEQFAFEKTEELLSMPIKGVYWFTLSDRLGDELKPLVSENKFRISWKGVSDSYLNQPTQVLCAKGLSWLMRHEGQHLCQTIGVRIQQNASEGRSSLILSVNAKKLRDKDSFIGTFPGEVFFIELISILGYKCKAQKQSNRLTSFEVSW